MAKSLFNQFSQIRGSRTYSDDLPLTVSGVQVAELAGHSKELNFYVDISGTTVTRTSGAFEKRDLGNVLLIGGSAYGITAADGTATCTVSSAPGNGTGVPAALMYYQNLEDDLNYIRTMLREITGLTNWYNPPPVALSELTFNFIELVDVFIGGGTYTSNNMLYTVSSGVVDTTLVTFNPATSMFTAANITTGGTLDVAGSALFQSNVTVSGSFKFDTTGQAVDTIVTTIGAGSTNSELPTAAAVYNYVDTVAAGIDTFLELGDTFSFYTANNMMYTTASGVADTNKMTYTPGTDTFALSAAIMNVTGAVTMTSTLDVDGAVDFDSTLNVALGADFGSTLDVTGAATFDSNVRVDGTLNFDAAGQTVDAIVTSISEPGLDTNLTTEQAIVEYVTAVSGVLFNQIEGIDTFIELEDTPNNYNNTKLVYSLASGVAYASELSYDGSNFNITVPTYISQDVRTDGDLQVGQTLTVTGTSILIGDTNVQGSLDVDTNLNVDGNSVVDGNSIVGGNVTVSGTFQLDAAGQAVNEISIIMPVDGDYSDNKLVTEQAIFEFVTAVSGTLAASTAAQTFLSLTDTHDATYQAKEGIYYTSSGVQGTDMIRVTPGTSLVLGSTNFGGGEEARISLVADEGTGNVYVTAQNKYLIMSDAVGLYSDASMNLTSVSDMTLKSEGTGAEPPGSIITNVKSTEYNDDFHLSTTRTNSSSIILTSEFYDISADASAISKITLDGDANSPTVSIEASNLFSQSQTLTFNPTANTVTLNNIDTQTLVSNASDHTMTLRVETDTGRLIVTPSGIRLDTGVYVNSIKSSITEPGAEDALATEKAIVDYMTAVSGILDQFTDLLDTPNSYSTEGTKLVFVNSAENALDFADNVKYTGTSLNVDVALDVDGATTLNSTLDVDGGTTLNSTLDVDGATTLNSTLDVDGAASFNNNVMISGTLKFDSTGQAVNEISISMDPAGGDDTTLLTENAIWDWVNTVSGVLQSSTAAQTFIALTDTDTTSYTAGNMFFTNAGATGIMDTAALKFDGTNFKVTAPSDFTNSVAVSGTLNVDGAADFDGAATFNNTLDVDGATTLNSSLDVDGDTTLHAALTVTSGVVMQSTLNVQGAGDFDTTLNVDGATILKSTLEVVSSAQFNNNVTVSGTFAFDTGTDVNEITTSMTAPGDDDTLLTEKAIYDWVNTVSGSLQGDVVWEVVDTPYEQIRPKSAHMGKAIYTSGDITIGGNLTVSGTTTTINTNELTVSDKLITVNAGEAGAGITGDPLAGIEIDRGSEANYLFVFDEQADNFRVGVSGTTTPGNTYNLQAVCTREDNPIDMRVPWWDATNYIYRNTGDTYIAVNSGTHTLSVVADSDTKMTVGVDNVQIYGDSNDYVEINSNSTPLFRVVLNGNTELDVQSGGLALDNGARVDDITIVIAEPGDDATLATEKGIVDYVKNSIATLSGSTNTFISLVDTPDDYQNTKLVFSTGSDIQYAMNLSYTGSGLVVSGTLNTTGAVDFDSTVNVDGGADFNSTVNVDGATTLNTTLDVDGATTLNSSVTVSGAADFQSTVDVDGAATFNSTVDVDGATTLNSSLDVDGATTLNTTLDVDGATTLNSSLVVSGTTNLQGATDIDTTLNVDGATTLNFTLDVDGATTLNSTLDVDGATTLNSSLVVSGTTNLQGATDIDSTLNVDGNADFKSNVTVTGTLNVDGAVDFDSTLNVAGATTLQTTINVQGAADFDSTVNVDGATTLQSILEVVGAAQFNNNVVVSGTFQFDAGEDVNNISATMTPPGDDDTLLTAGAIWDWVNIVSGTISTGGSLSHNNLQGLQGGAAGEYYHLDQTDYTVLSAITSTEVSNWNTAYGWGNHAGLYSLVSHLHDNRYYTETEIDATVSGINSTIATTSGTLQDQIDLLEEIHTDTEEPTGFVDRTSSAVSNDGTNVTVSGTSWDYYIKGTKYAVVGAKSVAIDGAFEGMQYFYMDTDSELHRINSWSNDLITDYAYVAAVYWDDANSQVIYMGDERHGVVMDAATHGYLHNTNGTVYISGLGITVVSGVDGNGSLNGHAQIGTTQGLIADEDIYHNIGGIAGIATIPVFYKTGNGGLWRKTAANNFPVKPFSGGSARLAWNQFTSGTWQQTETPKGDYVLAHIFATNDTTMQWIAVQGQATYDTSTQARLGATNEMNSLILTGLPFVEFVPVATIIYQTDEDFTNDINARIISTDEGDDYIDWTKTKLSPIPGSVNDHGSLSGLADLDHPAAAIYTDTTNFNGALSAADNTVQKALDTLDNAIAGIGHEHHDHDLAEVSTNVWEYTGDTGFTTVPTDLQVFVNGLKNRKTSDYYTAAISSGKITITFAYNVYTEDWINITYTKSDVA